MAAADKPAGKRKADRHGCFAIVRQLHLFAPAVLSGSASLLAIAANPVGDSGHYPFVAKVRAAGPGGAPPPPHRRDRAGDFVLFGCAVRHPSGLLPNPNVIAGTPYGLFAKPLR
ncbi:hypothetical protein [Sandarakinorhabdus sp. DWP1-3-1]|uniref:hypothetical protein n=1 Tax=Sandarakinorhabdus sp. DWP1-3-1 TaxID=2804627 RepID=UPI003CF1B6E3